MRNANRFVKRRWIPVRPRHVRREFVPKRRPRTCVHVRTYARNRRSGDGAYGNTRSDDNVTVITTVLQSQCFVIVFFLIFYFYRASAAADLGTHPADTPACAYITRAPLRKGMVGGGGHAQLLSAALFPGTSWGKRAACQRRRPGIPCPRAPSPAARSPRCVHGPTTAPPPPPPPSVSVARACPAIQCASPKTASGAVVASETVSFLNYITLLSSPPLYY